MGSWKCASRGALAHGRRPVQLARRCSGEVGAGDRAGLARHGRFSVDVAVHTQKRAPRTGAGWLATGMEGEWAEVH